ncbi:unannotated protein [freshwater metagenome]|uniref:Unannotated protein n=1 Tax=freshwater metagenome TaxID=449393 RepID=A0A6J7CGV0_9ZZZZ|nr:DUF2752 domain-containing protein [Actinomycetota bacterium]MSX32053.1 DUF2752 domain-containing protein [Actinomycetota bacterium]MSX82032.1 DUF2752 domain-containing protein [Actinomycetota bacterium]
MHEATNQSSLLSSDESRSQDSRESREVLFANRRDALLGGVVILGGAALIGAVDTSGGSTLCPFRLATGLDCPFCGGTRATHSFLNAHIGPAFDHNVLVAVFVPVALLVGVLLLWRGITGRGWRVPMPSRNVWIALGFITVIFWVLRNIPAFSWLGSS